MNLLTRNLGGVSVTTTGSLERGRDRAFRQENMGSEYCALRVAEQLWCL